MCLHTPQRQTGLPALLGSVFVAAQQLKQGVCEKGASNVALVLDWDDTIFPTTWVKDDVGLSVRTPLQEQIVSDAQLSSIGSQIVEVVDHHIEKAIEFLDEATSKATVFIVTLAGRSWIEETLNNIFPELARRIQHHQIEFIYAKDFLEQVAEMASMDASNLDFECRDHAIEFWTKVKEQAMLDHLKNVQTQTEQRWDAIVSVGDSDYERYGAMAACKELQTDCENSMFVKTVKFVSKPTIEELTAQLVLMNKWLPFILAEERDMDIEIAETEDDDLLMDLHKKITGEQESLSWMDLATE